MKAQLYTKTGDSKSQIEMPKVFDSAIRADIAQKFKEVYELENRIWYSPSETAGRRHSASGTISHRRHEWKGHYGKGISRAPRKAMWRRGTQFYWVGAEVSGSRGGRSVHAPSGVRSPLKMNKKETLLAMNSAFAATANPVFVKSRYSTMLDVKTPIVIESLPQKTKEFIQVLQKIFADNFKFVLKNKVQRAGKGKSRGRRYKSNAGLLLVVGKNEKATFSGLDVRKVGEVKITDLFPLGRLTLYTHEAIKEMEAKK